MNRVAHACDTGRVSHGQISARLQRHLGNDFDLPTDVHKESAIGNLQHLDAVDVFDGVDNRVFVFAGDGVNGDVADDVVATDADDIDGANVAAGFANRRGNFTEGAGARRKF